VILADTSAWIEFDGATGSPAHRRLAERIRSGDPVAVTEPVLMEVMAGARSDQQAERLRRMLVAFEWLPFDPIADFEGAAKIYRSCRAAGITPRGMVDCMIANVAMRTGAALLAADRDFEAMADVLPLRLDTA
jgi:predicted nucleic acid-binding protein